jgi:acetyl esterase
MAKNADKVGATEERMAVCGDSAGGNLAAVVSFMAKDRQGPSITNQILIYPIIDLLDQNYQDYPDDRSPALTKSDMNWFIEHYISRKEDLENQYASPISRADLTNVPSALFITAEYDILKKQCDAYANLLMRAGVRVHSANYPGLVHGFFTLPDVFDDAHDAVDRIAKELA